MQQTNVAYYKNGSNANPSNEKRGCEGSSIATLVGLKGENGFYEQRRTNFAVQGRN